MDLFDKKHSIKVFKGKCLGVHLKMRGTVDPYVLYSIIVEDDENWYDNSKCGGAGSGWILDLMEQFIHAMNWMNIYCVHDRHGWTLKYETLDALYKGELK